MPTLSYRKRIAITHRIGLKTILQKNIDLMQILMRILIRFKGGTAQEVKMAYMQRVEDFETDSDVMFNRLKLRRYLRELLMNQTRILKHKAEMVLQKKKEEEEPESTQDLDPYLTLVEYKKKESKTLYFEDKHQPSQLDNEIWMDIQSKGV